MSVSVHHSDMLQWLAEYDGPLFDSCICDAPYHLTSIVKRWGRPGVKEWDGGDGLYQRSSRGFMGKTWDGGDIAQRPETWRAVYDCLKPGSHLIAFAGTRTYHRMACAIEDAGFEIRDQLAWVYGSGFPKSHNQKGEWQGWGTALKPAWEPICFARKPLVGTVAANLASYGTGALNIDGCRIGTEKRVAAFTSFAPCHGNQLGAPGTAAARRGTQGEPKEYDGRWPANILHDSSDEVLAAFPADAKSGSPVKGTEPSNVTAGIYGDFAGRVPFAGIGDNGSAARFFYSAKAGPLDRIGTDHATVKPVDLMRWLCRLVTPPGGHVLDPFAGSGTTGIACMAEGFNCTLIELEADHVTDIERKLAHLRGEGRTRMEEHLRSKERNPKNPDMGPLFGGPAT